jgi:hypothetical protein
MTRSRARIAVLATATRLTACGGAASGGPNAASKRGRLVVRARPGVTASESESEDSSPEP